MKNRVLITGAGSGIGLAIASLLDQRGYHLILLGRDKTKLDQAIQNFQNQHQTFSCDIRKPEEINKALQSSSPKNLYAVIINAGVGGENQYGEADRWQEIIDTNLSGSYFTAHETIPFLKKNTNGFRHIVFISSILARLGVPGYSAYCASKAGILGLMRSLSNQLTQDKILVNALCPGWVNTEMAHEGLQSFADFLKISKDEAFKQAMNDVPLGKMSEPEEIAQMVAFLISGDQVSITGQTLDINNGALMP